MSTLWTIIVPVKGSASTKSRLVPPAGISRTELGLAFAFDTISAARTVASVRRIVVLAGHESVHQLVRAVERSGRGGCPVDLVLQDRDDELNGAVARLARGLDSAVAVLLGDLPTLRPSDLSDALGDCIARTAHVPGGARAFVPDAQGTGTTVLMDATGNLNPRFGTDSAAMHMAAGYLPLPAAASLRLDIDTRADLDAVPREALGLATTALLAQGAPRDMASNVRSLGAA